MLQSTFLHVDGIGLALERRLWDAGVRSWEALDGRAVPGLGEGRRRRLHAVVRESRRRLARGDHAYFARRLPGSAHWRAWPEFRGRTAYLDIETTGLSPVRDEVTVVGLYDGQSYRALVRDKDLHTLPEVLRRYAFLVTFNGARFDLPFLAVHHRRARFDHLHVDLRYPLRALGFSGGLKAIERELGMERTAEIEGLGGYDAVRLWREYEAGDDSALELLLRYNQADVVVLERLLRMVYTTGRGRLLGR